ncbi:MAG: metallophosphoesterase [Salinisphaera sp.]|nr:metallophosphoesterase [Salinisphaera sp.]
MVGRDALLIQISDTHLLADPQAQVRGWNNQLALDAVLAHVQANYPRMDALLLTGDLVHDESPAGYRRLAQQLRRLDVPVHALPGNHDDPALMRKHLSGIGQDPFCVGGWQVQLLDSHVAGSDAGRLGRQQMERLARGLGSNPDTPTLVAVHHPAAPIGVAWLDGSRLADGAALLQLAAAHAQIQALLCGHVHHPTDTRSGGVRQLTAPAVTRQFAPRGDVPKIDARRAPGYRVLRLGAHGRLRTRVRRVADAQACAQETR